MPLTATEIPFLGSRGALAMEEGHGSMLDRPSAIAWIAELLGNRRASRFHSRARRPLERDAVTGFRQSRSLTGLADRMIGTVPGRVLRRQRPAGAWFRSSVR